MLELLPLLVSVAVLVALGYFAGRHEHRWEDWVTYTTPGGVPVLQTRKCTVKSCSKIKKRRVR